MEMKRLFFAIAVLVAASCQKVGGPEDDVVIAKAYSVTAADMYQSAIGVASLAGLKEQDVSFVLLLFEHAEGGQVVAQNSMDNEKTKAGCSFTANHRSEYVTIKYEMSFWKNGTYYNTGKWVSNVFYLDDANNDIILTSHTATQDAEPK